MNVLYICNTLDDKTRECRSITTDSPAGTKKTFDIVRPFGRKEFFSDGNYTKNIADVLFATVQKLSHKNERCS